MAEAKSNGAKSAFRELERRGLLMLADAKLSSLTTLITGGPVRGSWWAHPRGQEIYAVASELGARADVLELKLVAGKVTFVHRKLWPSVLAVALARADWQTRDLPGGARTMLAKLGSDASMRCDDKATTEAARELQARLLALTSQVHTESGAHALQVEPWERWAARVGITEPLPTVSEAKLDLERAVTALGAADASALMPWRARRGAAKR